MPVSDFRIATTAAALAGEGSMLKELGIEEPAWDYLPYSVERDLGDGSQSGQGWKLARWHWGVLTKDEYDILRALGSGKSVSLFIKTKLTTLTYDEFSAQMIWPPRGKETWDNDCVRDFTLVFRKLVEV